MISDLTHRRQARTARVSSWDVSGRNGDSWQIKAGETRVLADLRGPGCISHIWMTQWNHYRECLLRFTWDNADRPSVLVPLGDFFCLGHNLVNSFQSFLFSASTNANNQFNQGCALNCYAQMPFRERALIELINESSEDHNQYFNQAWGNQPNAFMRNGSSLYTGNTHGYQTSYIFHLENPVRFEKEIKVTIEHGHGNHLRNEMSTVAYWYAARPTPVKSVPPLKKRAPVLRNNLGEWLYDSEKQITSREIEPNAEMLEMKRRWQDRS